MPQKRLSLQQMVELSVKIEKFTRFIVIVERNLNLLKCPVKEKA